MPNGAPPTIADTALAISSTPTEIQASLDQYGGGPRPGGPYRWEPAWRRNTLDEAEALLTELGLTAPLSRLQDVRI